MRLQGRSALVTGGSRGIGKGIALSLAREGADLAISYVEQKEAADKVVQEITALGRKAVAIQADIAKEAEATNLVHKSARALGKLDLLVNNAATPYEWGRYVADSDPAVVRRVVEVNFLGAYYCTRAALPYLRQPPRGDVIFLSSTATKHAHAGGAPYVACKAALEGFARALAKEEQPNNVFSAYLSTHPSRTPTSGRIRVNVVAPTLVETEMGELVAGAAGRSIAQMYGGAPFGRLLKPDEVGRLVAFLCSENEYISGQIIYMDGARF